MSDLTVLHGCRTLQLTRGMNTLIEEADFELVGQFKWYAHKTTYAFYAARRDCASGENGIFCYLHRVLTGALPKTDVDHKNGDSLDNRRHNHRVTTHTGNMRNQRRTKGSSRFKGVTRAKDLRPNPWQARLVIDYKTINLGHFSTEEEAARAYDEAAKKHFGEFACTNADIHGPY